MRTISEEHTFRAIADKIFGSARTADEQLDAATWKLARETSFAGPGYRALGAIAGVGNAYIVRVDAFGGWPALSVYFAVSSCDTKITLLDLLPDSPAAAAGLWGVALP